MLREAVIAALLVAVMILVFVGSWRSTFIVCISIPVSILVAIIGLKLTGQTLNLMTLGGLALAIGMLVDDATVEIENINRNRAENKPILRAILDGAHQVAQPALAATFTICIVFFPVVLLSGPARYLFVPLALSVVFAMVASYVLSRTLVPTLSSMLLGKERLEHDVDLGTFFGRLESRRQRMFEHAARGLREGAGARARAAPLRPRRGARPARRQRVPRAGRRARLLPCGRRRASCSMHFRGSGRDAHRGDGAHRRSTSSTRCGEIIPPGEIRTIDDNIGVPLFYNLGSIPSDNVDGADAEILVALSEQPPADARVHEAHTERGQRGLPGMALYFMQGDIVGQGRRHGRHRASVRDLGPLPTGVSIKIRGQGDTMFTAFERLGLGMIVAITLVYLLLVVLFQSWMNPFLIMLAVPGALAGILWFLVATGTTLNVESFMGAIMAIGIAASNSILLVSFANAGRLEDASLDPVTAACRAAETRLRPVLMTALAMILGMLPMALGLGEGGEQNARVLPGTFVRVTLQLHVPPGASRHTRRS